MGAAVSCCCCARRSHRSSPPTALPYLPDDMLAEVFVRLPAHPADLRRVSLVSEQFRGVVADGGFLRSFRSAHGGKPPLVGLFTNHDEHRFLPVRAGEVRAAAAAGPGPGDGPLCPDDSEWFVLGSRHGRVLLQSPSRDRLLVLEPMARRRQYVPAPPDHKASYFNSAAVLCGADHGAHDDCLPHPFRIVFVSCHHSQAVVSIYSSGTGAWSDVTASVLLSAVDMTPSVHRGKMIYWEMISHSVLAFNMDTNEMREIMVPEGVYDNIFDANFTIMAMSDGKLGLAVVSGYILTVWAFRTHGPDTSEWVLRKLVRLDALMPLRGNICRLRALMPHSDAAPVKMIGIDEDENVAFLWAKDGVFAINLETVSLEKVLQSCIRMDAVYPYKTFLVSAGGRDGGNVEAEDLR